MDIHYTFKKYEEAYPLLLNNFLSDYEDNGELDFWTVQLDKYKTCLQNVTLLDYGGNEELPEIILRGYSMYDDIKDKIYLEDETGRSYDYEMIDRLNRSFKKIIQFINSKIEGLKKKETTQEKKEDIFDDALNIDLSDSNGTEKIIMLYKLGILDFLKSQSPFNASTNSLASAISGITGLKLTTVQPYLNPIYSKETHQKNNPLESKKALEKVENKLLKIGFKPLK